MIPNLWDAQAVRAKALKPRARRGRFKCAGVKVRPRYADTHHKSMFVWSLWRLAPYLRDIDRERLSLVEGRMSASSTRFM